jgi:hypothetical protein
MSSLPVYIYIYIYSILANLLRGWPRVSLKIIRIDILAYRFILDLLIIPTIPN